MTPTTQQWLTDAICWTDEDPESHSTSYCSRGPNGMLEIILFHGGQSFVARLAGREFPISYRQAVDLAGEIAVREGAEVAATYALLHEPETEPERDLPSPMYVPALWLQAIYVIAALAAAVLVVEAVQKNL